MADGTITTAALRTELQRTMQNNAAVFRTGEVLQDGCDITQEIYDDLSKMKVYDRGMVSLITTGLADCLYTSYRFGTVI